MADNLTKAEKKRREEEKRAKTEARRRAEAKRTKDPKLTKKTPPKPVKRGIFPEEPKTKATVSVKPGSVIDVMSGKATKKRLEKATKPKKRKK